MTNNPVGPVDATQVPRFAGETTFARLPRLADVPDAEIAVLGVPFDGGVSYRPGARFGPNHVRQSSRLLRPYNPAQDVEPFLRAQVADAGDLAVNPFSIAEAVAAIEAGARELSGTSRSLLTIGGDHTIALPLLRVQHERHGPVAVLHFDAHLDTWDTYFGEPYTHGTPFRRAAEEGLTDPDALDARGAARTAVRPARPRRVGAARLRRRALPGLRPPPDRRDHRAGPGPARRPSGLRQPGHRRARPGASRPAPVRRRPAGCPAPSCWRCSAGWRG